MRPAKSYRCEVCRDSGYVPTPFGIDACPNCRPGQAATSEHNREAAGNSPASLDGRPTPAQVACVLKIILHVGAVLALGALYYYSGGSMAAEANDVTAESAGPDEFSAWEPEA